MMKEEIQYLSYLKKRNIYVVLSLVTLVFSIVLNNNYFLKRFKRQETLEENTIPTYETIEQQQHANLKNIKELLQLKSSHNDSSERIDVGDVGDERTDLNYIVNYNGGELEPEWNWVKNISIVYTWVDGSDKDFLDLKSKFNGGIRRVSSRDRSADELRYSLRSLQKYMPWHQGTIYIVTSQQIPNWLDTSHPRIQMVYHKDIFPPHLYPTYDSNTIELFFDKIPGITERFLYFNDDVFLNHYIHPCFFFTSDTFYPKIYRNVKRKINKEEVDRITQSNNIHEIFQASKYYTRQAVRDYFDPEFEYRDLFHTVHVFYRDLFEPYRHLFAKELRHVYGNRFRHPTKVQTIYLYQAFLQYATEHDEFPLKYGGEGKAKDFKGFPLPANRTIETYSCKIISSTIANQFIKFGRISNNSKRNYRYFNLFKTSPNIFIYNFNDAYSKNRALYEFTEYMITRYPEPASFEKMNYVSLEKEISSKIETINKNITFIDDRMEVEEEDQNLELLDIRNTMVKSKLNIIRSYLRRKESLSKKVEKIKNNIVQSMSSREKDELRFLLSYHGEELSPEWQWAKNISMVYVLDDPQEVPKTNFIEKILIFIFSKLVSSSSQSNNSVPRQQNIKDTHQELKYSLRSIEKYLPWYQGKIYIVLPSSVPKDSLPNELSWLDFHHDRIQLIYFNDILSPSADSVIALNQKKIKDCPYNRHQRPIHSERHQIEMYLDKIPGITKHFIYMRPHYFFSNYTHPRFFFSSSTSLYFNDFMDSTSTMEFYPKYSFKPPYPIPSDYPNLPKKPNSFNYTSSILLDYFGSNYIKTYQELQDAPIPFYRDLFPATRQLFKEEWSALYSPDVSCHQHRNFKYDLLPLYLVTNFNRYGAAQPLYPDYIVGYGKIQDQRMKREQKEEEKRENIRKQRELATFHNHTLHQPKEVSLLYTNPFSRLFPFKANLLPKMSSTINSLPYHPTYYGYDITSSTVMKYTMVTREFKRYDPRYNRYLMKRLLPTPSHPSKLFFSLKWNQKEDLSPRNQHIYKKLMNYLYKEKSSFEHE